MIAKKLKIKPGTIVTLLHAPKDFSLPAAELPEGCSVRSSLLKEEDFVLWFTGSKSAVEKEIDGVVKALRSGALLWIAFPKKSSGIQTDLSRDEGWDCLKGYDMQWCGLISLNETWSAFCLRNLPASPKQELDRSARKPVATQDYDPIAKTVQVPEDLQGALENDMQARQYFESLAFSHRKEYVLWITSAKKPETRGGRIEKTIKMLSEKRKNPSDK